MRATIDAAGRIVVPKPVRDALGFAPGAELELHAVDGRLEVALPHAMMRLEERDGTLVAVPEVPAEALTADVVRATLEQSRR